MTLRELLAKVEGLPPDTPVCTAEIDEAFGINIADLEVVEDANVGGRKPDGKEAIELGNGNQRVLVIRW